jgi:cyclophilin family peptidyl-prolyl cis-trans isomerase
LGFRARRAILALLVLLGLTLAVGCGKDTASSGAGSGCSYPTAGEAAKPVKPPATTGVRTTGTARYVLHLKQGNVSITLDRAKAPCTVNSFESLAKQGYFDQTSCHRLTTEGIFVLQCGDPTGSGRGGPGYSFADETTGHDTYLKGVVAMANAGKNTNGSQFFLVYADSKMLDKQPNYTVFGQLDAASVAVVAKIAAAGTDAPGDGHPLSPVKITSVTAAGS